MIEKKLYECVSSLFLFQNVEQERVEKLITNMTPELKSFSSGEIIYSPKEFKTKIGFVVNGSCAVERQRSDGVPIPLNLLKAGNAFGVLSVFSEGGEFPTCIRAKNDTDVLFFDKNDILYAVRNEPEVAINILYFLGDRIAFLNNKLSTFSADNVEQKVAKFLMYESKRYAANSFRFNCKKTSEALNIGRASLYRAIDQLTADGIITLENKIINITDPDGLERITK